MMKRPCWLGITKSACVSSFRWNDSEEAGMPSCSLILLAARPAGPACTNRRKVASRD